MACEKKGPAEKAGESIDKAVEDVTDAVDKDGPIENTVENIEEHAAE